MKFNLYAMNIIIHFFTKTDQLLSFINDVNHEEGGQENLANFANGFG